MRHLPVRGLAVVLAVLILGCIPLVNAQEATPPVSSPPPDWSGIVEVVSVTPLEGSAFDLVLLRVTLAPGDGTGPIDNDLTRMMTVVEGQIEFRPTGGEATTLAAGDTLAISATTDYDYENTGDTTAVILVSTFVPTGAVKAGGTPPAFPQASPEAPPTVAAAPTPRPGGPHTLNPTRCLSGCTHP